MKLSNPVIAAIIGSLIAGVSFFILLSLEILANNAIVVSTLLILASGFVITYATLEFLVFREINKVKDLLKGINKRSDEPDTNNSNGRVNLRNELIAYRDRKENEVEELRKLAAFRKEFIADVSHEA